MLSRLVEVIALKVQNTASPRYYVFGGMELTSTIARP